MTITNINLRGNAFSLNTHNRSLSLCARMNYETDVLDFIDNIPLDKTFYDLGACEGRFSVYAAIKGLSVVAFEPEKDNFDTLQKNIILNKLEGRISAFQMGVGESSSQAKLKIGQPWAGGHQKVVENQHIRNDLNFQFVAEQTVEIVSLDQIIIDSKLPTPNYIKIDVDGSELSFLLGAKKSIADASTINFELNTQDSNFDYIIETIEKIGLIEESRHPVPNEDSLFNFIFVKQPQ